MTKDLVAPCKECAFRRDIKPGALGGSPATTYIGQAVGPFVVPCHMACDFSDPQWREKSIDTPQCAGMAVFRANIGVGQLMPDKISRLPPDRNEVFASHAEFLAHHERVPVETAQAFLKEYPPARLLQHELSRPEVITHELKENT